MRRTIWCCPRRGRYMQRLERSMRISLDNCKLSSSTLSYKTWPSNAVQKSGMHVSAALTKFRWVLWMQGHATFLPLHSSLRNRWHRQQAGSPRFVQSKLPRVNSTLFFKPCTTFGAEFSMKICTNSVNHSRNKRMVIFSLTFKGHLIHAESFIKVIDHSLKRLVVDSRHCVLNSNRQTMRLTNQVNWYNIIIIIIRH